MGVDDEAAALLEQYDYPYNRTQFKRILKEAVIRTEGPYICAQTIQEVIRRKMSCFPDSPFRHVHPWVAPAKTRLLIRRAIRRRILIRFHSIWIPASPWTG